MKKVDYMAAYLPHGLVVMLAGTQPLKVSVAGRLDRNEISFTSAVQLDDYMPILYPLSVATEEPMLTTLGAWIKKQEGENFDSVESAKEWLKMAILLDPMSIPHKVVVQMHKEMIDMYGLVELGLAYVKGRDEVKS